MLGRVYQEGVLSMNKVISTFFLVILINNLYGLDYRKVALVKHNIIPVLYVNDYIVEVSSGYKALLKEACLFETSFTKDINLYSPHVHKRCHKTFPYKYPKYPTIMCDALEDFKGYTMLTEEDFKYVCKLPENIRICVSNVACGIGMFGILLLLTFCK